MALPLARLCSSMWVGAALLFVLTSVAEQTHPAFAAATRSRLALVRFPWYYGTGATLLGTACLASASGRRRSPAILLLLAGLLMCGDYFWIYWPLAATLADAGDGDSAVFGTLHRWSELVNSVGFLLTGAAAVQLCLSCPPAASSSTA